MSNKNNIRPHPDPSFAEWCKLQNPTNPQNSSTPMIITNHQKAQVINNNTHTHYHTKEVTSSLYKDNLSSEDEDDDEPVEPVKK